MSKIRKAHSVELIERRLKDAEATAVDGLELAGIHDELARIERKWREQIDRGSDRRQPGDPARMDAYFDRLRRQIESALRRPNLPEDERSLVTAALESIRSRSPL